MEEKGAASGMMDRPLLGRAILKLLLQLGTDKARTGRYHRICGENKDVAKETKNQSVLSVVKSGLHPNLEGNFFVGKNVEFVALSQFLLFCHDS
jgi:hypothetical protein